MTRCFHGKRRYYTRADAELVLGGIDTRDPRRREVRCYQCPACHGWHLTSQTIEQYAASPTPPVRAPIKLDVPVSTSPVPTPAQLAARLGARPITTPAPHPAPTISRLRTLFDRIRRQLAERRRR
ncbi:hypothetical protein ACWF9G_28965 [Nocardia sp. NPDC055029]